MALILKHILMETAKLPQSRLLNVLAKFGVGSELSRAIMETCMNQNWIEVVITG